MPAISRTYKVTCTPAEAHGMYDSQALAKATLRNRMQRLVNEGWCGASLKLLPCKIRGDPRA